MPQPSRTAAMGAGGNGWRVRPVTGRLASARTIAAATGACPAENLLPAAWRRVSLAVRIPCRRRPRLADAR